MAYLAPSELETADDWVSSGDVSIQVPGSSLHGINVLLGVEGPATTSPVLEVQNIGVISEPRVGVEAEVGSLLEKRTKSAGSEVTLEGLDYERHQVGRSVASVCPGVLRVGPDSSNGALLRLESFE